MLGAYDPVKPRVYWAFRTSGNTAQTLDKLIFYDWSLQRWGKADLTCEYLFPATTTGYTLEGLDAFGTLDTLPYSLDSNLWGGGNPGIAAFATDHTFGFVAGPNVAASFRSAEMALNGLRLVTVTGVTPVTDADGVTIQIGVRDRRGNADPISWGAASSMEVDGSTHQHATGRYVTM